MPLTILSDADINEYVSGLDLAEGSEAYKTLNAMLLLPSDTFKQAISAVYANLITFQNIRTLPAMNQKLVEQLINSKLGEEDSDAKAWKYKNIWFPATVDVATMKAHALGDISKTIAAKFIDRWGGVIQPSYDFLKTDETKFFSYIEAYTAYMVALGDYRITNALSTFNTVLNATKTAYPMLFNSNGGDAVQDLFTRITTLPLFLERSTGGRTADALLDWIMSGSWAQVIPSSFNTTMDEAYGYMSTNDTPAHTGIEGSRAFYNAVSWTSINSKNLSSWLDRIRIAKIYLPEAYGDLVVSTALIETNREINNALVAYLTAAKTAITTIQSILALRLSEDASQYRAVSGASIGFLLAFTNA